MIVRCALAALLLWQVAGPATDDAPADPKYFRYQRPLSMQVHKAGQTCATLDATVFAHASAESLNDLRLYSGATETPFTLTESSTEHVDEEAAKVQNLGMRDGNIVFDLAMPHRPYTAVELDLSAKDFFGTANIAGSDGKGGAPVEMGSFALFDLSSQHLSRSTELALEESTFPDLHVTLHLTPSPGSHPRTFEAEVVKGASVPPSREAQTLFTSVAEVTSFEQRGHRTIGTVHLPAHVPVERISFALDPAFHKNFLRTVNITARPDGAQDTAALEDFSGDISQVQLPPEFVSEPSQMHVERLAIDSALGADLRRGATVQIAIENGDDSPLPLRAVQLAMRERRLCFDSSANSTEYHLLYGSEGLRAPQYDYARLFTPSANLSRATLGTERLNPDYTVRADTRPYSERHPELLWVALIAAVAALGAVAFRSARKRR